MHASQTHPHPPLTVTSLATLNGMLDMCSSCATVAHGYRHVPGGGCVAQPELMLVFINPTFRNISAHADWPGVRMPFAVKPQLWQILAEAGWVRADLPLEIAALGPTPAMVAGLADEAGRQRIYLTNAVKCVEAGSEVPVAERVAAAWPWLEAEIGLVQPRQIAALGLLPFRLLTSREVRLADELWAAEQGAIRSYPSRSIGGRIYPVFPCYFPTGRGNPVGATKLLAALRQHLRISGQAEPR